MRVSKNKFKINFIIMVNKMSVLQEQFKQDKLEGMTLCTKFAEWKKEQTDIRLEEIQSREVVKVLDTIEKAIVVNREVIVGEVRVSKSSIAKVIFEEEMLVGLVRKTVLGRFMLEAGLTVAGANTYYNNLRDKHGLVIHKV